jgi:hypothetical protein
MAFLAQQHQDEADKKAVTQKSEEQRKKEAEEKAILDEEERKKYEPIDTSGTSCCHSLDCFRVH